MGVRSNIKLIFSYLKLNLKKEFNYKTSFFLQIVAMVLNDLFMIIQWTIIFKYIDSFAGYGFNETMLLISISAGGFGVSRVFFAGAWDIKDIVYNGKLDVFLTQPKNVLVNVCSSRTQVDAIGDLIYTYIVLIIIHAQWWWFLIMPIVLVFSGLIYTATYVTYASLCFWINKGDAVAKSVEGTINKAGNYPPTIYNSVVKILFFTLIPTFFYTFVPAQYFFLSFNPWWILGLVGVTALWVAIAFFVFNRGLKKYNSGNLMGGRL